MERCVCRSTWSAIDDGPACVGVVGCPSVPCDDDPNGPWCDAEVLPCRREYSDAFRDLVYAYEGGEEYWAFLNDPNTTWFYCEASPPPPPALVSSPAPPVAPPAVPPSAPPSARVSWVAVASAFLLLASGATCATARASVSIASR